MKAGFGTRRELARVLFPRSFRKVSSSALDSFSQRMRVLCPVGPVMGDLNSLFSGRYRTPSFLCQKGFGKLSARHGRGRKFSRQAVTLSANHSRTRRIIRIMAAKSPAPSLETGVLANDKVVIRVALIRCRSSRAAPGVSVAPGVVHRMARRNPLVTMIQSRACPARRSVIGSAP
jgi:hypothetical protein